MQSYPASYLLLIACRLYVEEKIAGAGTYGHAEGVICAGFYLDRGCLLIAVLVFLPQFILVFGFRYALKGHLELQGLKVLLVGRYGSKEHDGER